MSGIMPHHKYSPYPVFPFPDRTWPDQLIDRAPIWCSVDLRDGNQALVQPMDPVRKMHLYERLLRIGFKEIEVGFPSASKDEFFFIRRLIEGGRVPDDVTLQVLVPAREAHIETAMQALKGARRAIVHLYNSTSTLQRRLVFRKSRREIINLALAGVGWIQKHRQRIPETEIHFQYSPESFTGTEPEFAADISQAVLDHWQPEVGQPMILNLPATVEMSTPNQYADRIEWMRRRFSDVGRVLLSVHAHNDRGCAVAATELALMAGADRVEGTLFGNGERTGNVDIVTLAMNLFTQGLDPGLNFTDMPGLVDGYESCTYMTVPPRHPYAGALVFSAFSGSHQDAVRKGLQARTEKKQSTWQVPYLPLDPEDIGRFYEPVIRINSQSGKAGTLFLLEQMGYQPPGGIAMEIGPMVLVATEKSGGELQAKEIETVFQTVFVNVCVPYALGSFQLYSTTSTDAEGCRISARVDDDDRKMVVDGEGTGPVGAFVNGLEAAFSLKLFLDDYHQHALGEGRDAEAVSYVRIKIDGNKAYYGVGRARDTTRSALQAVLAAINRGVSGLAF